VCAGGVADPVGATRASALRGSSTDLHRCRVLGLVVGHGEGRDQAVPSRPCSAMDWRTVGRSDGGRRASSADVGRRHSSRRISRWSSSHVPQRQNRPGVLEVRTAEDPGPAAGDAGVVACGEAVAINDLGSAGRQADWLPIVPTTARACWQTRGSFRLPGRGCRGRRIRSARFRREGIPDPRARATMWHAVLKSGTRMAVDSGGSQEVYGSNSQS